MAHIKLKHGMLSTGVKDLDKQRWGWTRWGGSNFGYGAIREEEEDWFCQCCGMPQPSLFPRYLIPMDKNDQDYMTICSACKHIQIMNKISKYLFIRKMELIRELVKYEETIRETLKKQIRPESSSERDD